MVYARTYAKKKLIGLLSDEIKESVPKGMLKNEGEIVEWRKSQV
jgi:hypothetical protein